MTQSTGLPAWVMVTSQHGMPGAPSWLTSLQQQAWQDFQAHGLPTRHEERWKYAELGFLQQQSYVTAQRTIADGLQTKVNHHRLRHEPTILMLLVNGYVMTAFSDKAKCPTGMIACGMEEALEKYPDLVKACWHKTKDTSSYPFANLNMAHCQDGLFLYVPDDCQVELPVHLLSIVDDEQAFASHPHHVIHLGNHSRLTLIEEYFAFSHQAYFMNPVLDINIGKGANLTHYKLQHEGGKAVHLGHTFVTQQQDSEVTYTTIATGSQFARDELSVNLTERGTAFRAAGFYHLTRDRQYMDHHVDVNHAAPTSQSEMLYKGILEQQSRAVFNGRLHVEKDAQKIIAYQANHNLLLSNQAEVYSKPELEIYADDVKCKHGASTGQMNQAALFYLRARGIPEEEARQMLLQGFADEILNRITSPSLRARVMESLP